MSDYLPVTFSQVPMQMSRELMAELRSEMDMDFAGFGGNFRRIKAGKMDFSLIDGGVTVSVPMDKLFGVLVASAPTNHCVWYAKPYSPGQEPEHPDLVWIQRGDGTFPEALPKQYHQKLVQNGKQGWGFQICRRTVWVLMQHNADGTMGLDMDKPYVMDITSASLYGEGLPKNNMYKFGGLRALCAAYCSPQYVVTPNMFPIQICLDNSVPIPSVMLFKPMMQNGMLQLLSPETVMQIRELRNSDIVKDLLVINEKLDYETDNTGTVVPPAPIQQPAVNPFVQPVQPVQPAANPFSQPIQPSPIQPMQQPITDVNADLLAQAQAAMASRAQQATAQPAQPIASAGVDGSKLAQAQAALASQPAAQPVPQPDPITPTNTSAAAVTNLLSQLG